MLFRSDIKPSNQIIIPKDYCFADVFINAIKSAIDTILLICGTLTCFLIMSTIIIHKFNFNEVFIKSILEITIGLKELSLYNLNDKHIIMLSSFIISFGGISIHTQVKAQLLGTNISIKPYLIGRLYQALISIPLAYIFYNLLT